jgi:hypothetical protein
MLLPYSASSTRRSIFWALLFVAVLAPAVSVVLGMLGSAPWLSFLSFSVGVAATTLLCVWCAVNVREEPGLVRIALIGGAVLFLLLTVALFWVTIAPPQLDTNMGQIRVRADIQGIRTMLLSYHDTNGYYPTTDQGLNALVPTLMEELPKDSWGTPYVYRCPGRANPRSYDLFSAGPDRIPDTRDDYWGK